ncbi:MAG: hypothetical protein KF693_12545 [Nitrospira sp.]|nr:hypothetical protein [Nitrospira sp.]
MLHTLVVSSNRLSLVQGADRTWRRSLYRCLVLLGWFLIVGSSLSWSNNPAWGETAAENSMIVAAGFGYQIGPVSVIAVKVYDAESGATLSDEVYELAVKENDNSGGTNKGPRIFAGGVGLGATDLSNFVLRVYDANTGAFQWEGRLNLVQPDRKGGLLVSATTPRRATVMKTQTVSAATEQPVFLLRALDATTGLSVWEDEFTAVHTRIPKVQPITGRSTEPVGISKESSHTFDFRIRMYDLSGQRILWEDLLSRVESDEGATESSGDRASILPAWPHQPPDEEAPAESI